MRTARTLTFESAARLDARLALVATVLVLGALLTCFPTHTRAAEPFDRGKTTGSILLLP